MVPSRAEQPPGSAAALAASHPDRHVLHLHLQMVLLGVKRGDAPGGQKEPRHLP